MTLIDTLRTSLAVEAALHYLPQLQRDEARDAARRAYTDAAQSRWTRFWFTAGGRQVLVTATRPGAAPDVRIDHARDQDGRDVLLTDEQARQVLGLASVALNPAPVDPLAAMGATTFARRGYGR